MAIQTEPTRISIPFADSGTKNTIPATNSTPSASQAASWTDGFPAQCSLPLSAGGIPPARADFNGIFNTMTQSERFTQEGGVWAWDATVDYGTNRLVLGSDGLLYWSVAQSGPNLGGAQDPTADSSHAYWSSPAVPTMPNTDSSAAAASTAWVNLWADDALRPAADYYVDSVNGDDSNDGLTAGAAKKTLAAAIAVVESSYGLRPSGTTIHIAAGTYTDRITASVPNIVLDFVGPSSGVAEVPGVFFQNCQNASIGLGGRFKLTNRVLVARGTKVLFQSGLYINFHNLGSTSDAFNIYTEGMVSMSNGSTATFEFTGTNTFSGGTVNVSNMSLFSIYGSGTTFSGTVTGPRYAVQRGSGIAGAGSTTKISGSSNGTTDTTSFYS